MIKVAVIGTGSMGRNHARVYSELPGVQLVAVSDSNLQTAEKVAAAFGGKAYGDYRELLDKEKPDAVSVAILTATINASIWMT